MTNKSKHKSGHDLAQLQTNLRRSESLRGAITAIAARAIDADKFTIADHSFTPVEKRSLVLKEDPNGNMTAPDGSSLVIRGTAFIQNSSKKVAVFRTP